MLPQGTKFVTHNGFGFVGARLWDVNSGKATVIGEAKAPVVSVAASKHLMAILYGSRQVEIWETTGRKLVGKIDVSKAPRPLRNAALSPDGQWIAIGSSDAIRVWNREDLTKPIECRGLSDVTRGLNFTNDSKFLLACTGPEPGIPGKLCVWEVASGKEVYSFSPSDHGCCHQALSPDNRWLATRDAHGSVRLWSFEKVRREIDR